MPRIIISCPTTGEAVPTGHRTQDIDLAIMSEPRSFRCTVCHQVHAWMGDDARVEDPSGRHEPQLAALRH